jgi:hypothetical protein
VRDFYDQKTGRKTHEIGLVQHRDYPWLGASPDGITEDGLLVEIKCPLTRKIEAKVPKHYLPQVQLQRFGFDDALIGNVADRDRRKSGWPVAAHRQVNSSHVNVTM